MFFIYLFIHSALTSEFNFPKNFKWCVATAAHQIEGNNIHSDWWQWEKKPGKIKNGDRSGKATDHWNLVDEDISLMKDLNINTYRFSISWAKIQPTPNEFNLKALLHYKSEIKKLKAQDIVPMVTLHHFVQPQWFTESGGWQREDSIEIFFQFTKKIYETFGEDIQYWTTFNEPMVYLGGGYIEGLTPPGVKGFDIKKPAVNILKAHAKIYHYIHSKNPEAMVGLAHHIRFLEPYRKWHPLDMIVAYYSNKIFNYSFVESLATGHLKMSIPFTLDVDERIEGLKGTQDYIGLNYYTRELLEVNILEGKVNRKYPLTKPRSDLNWELFPQGLSKITLDYQKLFPSTPFLITENGIADKDDSDRKEFLRSHIVEMAKLMKQDIPFLGYCYWTLMDNFEWIEGFEPRFGLYKTNYSTFKRTPRPSCCVL
jgi:beta-glucosidase